ncbi:unnamed protein product [Camellia sinensis]
MNNAFLLKPSLAQEDSRFCHKVRIAIAIAISPLHLLQWWLGLPQFPSPRVVVPVDARGHRPPLHNLAINPPPNLLLCLLSSPRTPHQCQAGNHLRLVSAVFHQYLTGSLNLFDLILGAFISEYLSPAIGVWACRVSERGVGVLYFCTYFKIFSTAQLFLFSLKKKKKKKKKVRRQLILCLRLPLPPLPPNSCVLLCGHGVMKGDAGFRKDNRPMLGRNELFKNTFRKALLFPLSNPPFFFLIIHYLTFLFIIIQHCLFLISDP